MKNQLNLSEKDRAYSLPPANQLLEVHFSQLELHYTVVPGTMFREGCWVLVANCLGLNNLQMARYG
jgi:hypothetical protein